MTQVGNVLAIALSGLQASTKRIAAVAENIANMSDETSLKPQAGAPPQFQPLLVTQTAQPGGGVLATFQPVTPASVTVPDSASPFADAQGLVALPNVDLGSQLIDALTAATAYKANAKIIAASQRMTDELLKIKT